MTSPEGSQAEASPSAAVGAASPARRSILQPLVYWFCWYAVHALFTLIYRMRRYHTGRVPRHGACIIASNHQSHLDPPLIGMCVTTRQVHFVARIGLFRFKPFAWLITALNSVPIREDEGDIGAIKAVLARLALGHPVVLFPEGSRSPDGAPLPFKRGVALLLKRSRCPVVPVAVEGCAEAFPKGARFPRLWGKRIAVMVGHPISHDELLKDGPDAALARLTGEIESMRLELRSKLRAATNGRYPPRGPGDSASRH